MCCSACVNGIIRVCHSMPACLSHRFCTEACQSRFLAIIVISSMNTYPRCRHPPCPAHEHAVVTQRTTCFTNIVPGSLREASDAPTKRLERLKVGAGCVLGCRRSCASQRERPEECRGPPPTCSNTQSQRRVRDIAISDGQTAKAQRANPPSSERVVAVTWTTWNPVTRSIIWSETLAVTRKGGPYSRRPH